MIVEEDVYLEHYGKKGMQWGVRTAKTLGRGGKKIGRGVKKTYNFSKDHPKTTATIIAGASFAAILLGRKGKAISSSRAATKLNSEHFKRLSETGFAWKDGRSSNWNYTLPRTSWAEATRGLK